MMTVYCTPSPARARQAQKSGALPVLLYGVGGPKLAGIGHPLMEECRWLTRSPQPAAWDFLSVALSVIAADSFVKRAEAADGWTRQIALTVEVLNPTPWTSIRTNIADTLRFLTGDLWELSFEKKGPPLPSLKRRRWKDSSCDCVCLFSGGLDSFIGALDLTAGGRTPYLVSCAYPKDAEKQTSLIRQLGIKRNRHFPGNPDPRWDHANETSMRARSFLFLAMGTLIASTLRPADDNPVALYLPENGFISLNVPLSARRLGSLSTRTTHPHFLKGVASMLNAIGVSVTIRNPYQFKTKGEMIRDCNDPGLLRKLASETVSCGKWKRTSQQCGRCLPCLIRRSAFMAADVQDSTDYRFPTLNDVDDPEDLLAVRSAYLAMKDGPEKWVRRSGPLPDDPVLRASFADVFRRGLMEVNTFASKAFT